MPGSMIGGLAVARRFDAVEKSVAVMEEAIARLDALETMLLELRGKLDDICDQLGVAKGTPEAS